MFAQRDTKLTECLPGARAGDGGGFLGRELAKVDLQVTPPDEPTRGLETWVGSRVGIRCAALRHSLPDLRHIPFELENTHGRAPLEAQRGPVLWRDLSDRIGIDGRSIRGIESVRHGPLPARQLGQYRRLGIFGVCRKKRGHLIPVVADREEGGFVSVGVLLGETAKIALAEQLGEDREARFERFDQARAIRAAVNTQPGFYRDARCPNHVRPDFRVAVQQKALKGFLDVRQAAHAARASARSASPRAASSSEHNSSRGGMLSSRSIMVDTEPKRRTAAPYNSHTGSDTGWSWV